MDGAVPLRKELPGEHVPASVEPGLPQLVGEALQPLHIGPVGLHERGVVVDLRGDEAVLLRPLPLPVAPLDEEPLHPGVAHPAGVAGEVEPLGKVVHAPQAALEGLELILRQLGGLVEKDAVVLLPLVAQHVALRVAVAKAQRAAVGKEKGTVFLPVLRRPGEQLSQRADVVVLQLRQGAPDDQQPDARIAQCEERRLHPDRPALAPAPGAAVGHIALPRQEEAALPGVGMDHQLNGHTPRAPRNPPGSPGRSPPPSRPRPDTCRSP